MATSSPIGFSISADDRPDAPLGTLLFRAGIVSEDELRDALEHALERGRRLGEVLRERGLVSERDLARILAGQKGLPFVDVLERAADPAAVRLIPLQKAREWGALAVAFEEGVPLVVVGDPADRQTFGEISQALGRKPRFAVGVPSELSQAIDAAYREAGDAPAAPVPAPPAPTLRSQVFALLASGERIEITAPLDRERALAEAKSLIHALDERRPGNWPFAGGRFLRPEGIVSVDVVELDAA